VQKLKFMIAVFFAVFPTLDMITADILVVLGYRVNSSSTYIFAKAYPPCSTVCLRQLTYLYLLVELS